MNHGFMDYCTSIRPSTSVIGSSWLIMPLPSRLECYQPQTSYDHSLGSNISTIDFANMYMYMYIHNNP